MINRILIKTALFTQPLLQRMGVNIEQLKVILTTKCTLDDRKPTGLHMYRKSSQKKSSGTRNMLVMLLYGAFFSMFLVSIPKPLLSHTVFITILMVYILMNLIVDFSTVLIDVRDHYFILPRPVNDRTVSASRTLYLLIHLSKIVIPLGLPGLLVVIYTNGWVPGLLYIVEIVSTVTLCVFSANGIYMMIFRFMNPRKFRDTIAYIQIVFVIVIFGGYRFFPEFLENMKTQHISPLHYTVSYFLPPVWIAGLHSLSEGVFNSNIYLFSTLAVISPLLCLAGGVKFLSGQYNIQLSLLNTADDKSTGRQRKNEDIEQVSWPDRIARWMTSSPMEQLGFRITWKLTARLREFKVRVYPAFGFLPLYFFYFAFIGNKDQTLAERWHHLPQTSFYLFILYSLVYISIVLLTNITRAKNYQAAWFYEITPYENPGQVLSGMLKSLLIKYHFSGAVIATIFVLFVWGPGIYLNIFMALVMVLMSTIFVALLQVTAFPFSQPASIEQQKGRVFYNLLFLLLPVGLGYFQYAISGYQTLVLILTLLGALGTWLMFRLYRRLGWEDIK